MASMSGPFIRRPVGTTLLAIGLFLVGLVAYAVLPVAPLPLRVPAQALPVGAGGGGSGVTFLVAMGSNVQCVSASVVDVAALVSRGAVGAGHAAQLLCWLHA